ncbi:MAG: hypothetical protein QM813_23075 [Verrucomicrobiota bacterium]
MAAPKSQIDFNSQFRPILSAKCFHCHGADEGSRKAKLRLDLRDEALREREGTIPIKPGDLKNSEVVRRITAGNDSDDLMPPTKAGTPLTPAEIELLKQWIQQGAPYATPLGRPDVHAVQHPDEPGRQLPRLPELRQHQRLQLM